MKFKKTISTFIMLAMVLVLSQSAFAAKGIGDDPKSAISLIPGKSMNLYIEDSTDKDWFTWTNDTGKTKSILAYAQPTDDWKNMRLAFKIQYNENTSTGLMYANYNVGVAQFIENVYIPSGAKLYILVEKVNNKMSQYTIYLNATDI